MADPATVQSVESTDPIEEFDLSGESPAPSLKEIVIKEENQKTIENIGKLRQQYIDKFFIKNPQYISFKHLIGKLSNIRNCCYDPYIISHPLYRTSLSYQQLNFPKPIENLSISALCSQFKTNCSLKPASNQILSNRPYKSIISLDMNASHTLLAAADASGFISIYKSQNFSESSNLT
jgi:hypothetical protein